MNLYQQTVKHQYIGPITLELYVIEIVKEDNIDPKKTIYKCRYFSEGKFITQEFYGFELIEID